MCHVVPAGVHRILLLAFPGYVQGLSHRQRVKIRPEGYAPPLAEFQTANYIFIADDFTGDSKGGQLLADSRTGPTPPPWISPGAGETPAAEK